MSRTMDSRIICSFINTSNSQNCDIEIPLDITCDEFVESMNESMKLNIEIPSNQAYFRSENPIALIQGEKTIGEIGLRTGSMIIFERQ